MELHSLWLPTLVSAVVVFFASFIIHMVLRYHSSDYTKLPNEDAVRAAIRAGNPRPAQYIIPYCATPKEMETPEMKQKLTEGPVAVLNLKPSGAQGMGPMLIQWFIFVLVVSFFLAYVAAHTLNTNAPFLAELRVVGTVGFLAYAGGVFPAAIWMGKPWPVAIKEAIDGLIYGLLSGAVFGWLWPR
jgi:hypothetical protein